MTDFNDEILENLQYNVNLNLERGLLTQDVEVRFCDWRTIGAPEAEDHVVQQYGKSEVILAADCTYSMDICAHLVRSIEVLLEHSCEGKSRREKGSNNEANVNDPIEAQRRFGPIALVAAVERNEETYAYFLDTLAKRRPHLQYFDCTAFAMAACLRTSLFCYGFKEKLRFICIYLA